MPECAGRDREVLVEAQGNLPNTLAGESGALALVPRLARLICEAPPEQALRADVKNTEKFRVFVSGGQGQNRTADTRIFSPLLYQLSYLALKLFIACANMRILASAGLSPLTC